MKPYLLVAFPVLLAALCFIPSSQSQSPVSGGGPGTSIPLIPEGAQAGAEIDFGNGGSVVNTINADGSSDQVGLQPGQAVTVTVSLANFLVGDTIVIEPLDGGCVLDDSGVCQDQSTNQTIVQDDGTIRFTFQAGNDPGVSQVSLHDANAEVGLKFWVIDPNDTVNVPLVVPVNYTTPSVGPPSN